MTNTSRRRALKTLSLSAILLCTTAGFSAIAQERTSVKIGYVVSKTGPNAGGAGITTIPNYVLWAKEVKDAGGLELPGGKRLPIEVIEYDDRSSAEEVVRATERLATQDKVDFILAPWGTGFNLAVAPLFDRFGYPQLAVSAVTDKAPQFVKRWKKSFWMLGGGHDYTEALAGVLTKAKAAGTINGKVAMISVADGFGIDLVTLPQCSHTEIDQVSRAGELDHRVRLGRRGEDRRQPEDGQQTPHQKARDDAGRYPETGRSARAESSLRHDGHVGPGDQSQ